jgi:hypothetical protein
MHGFGNCFHFAKDISETFNKTKMKKIKSIGMV